MIGNPKWFKRRKYGGWGITPATWQGWAYLAIFFVVMLTMSWFNLPVALILSAIFLIDTLDITVRVKMDEREASHEAFAERNAAWMMVAILAVGLLFQISSSLSQGSLSFDPFLLIALLGGTVTKALSNWTYLDK